MNYVLDKEDINTYGESGYGTVTPDYVNEPPHYKVHEMECIDEMLVVFGAEAVINFCKCNAWKYRYRSGHKDDAELDMKKSDWYLRKANELQNMSDLFGKKGCHGCH